MRIVFSILALWLMAIPCSAAIVTVLTGDGGNSFTPSMFTINPGDTVKWVWRAGHHNTSGTSVPAGAGTWYANLTVTDTSYSLVPSVSGLYKYTCTHHSGMDGQFFVTGCSYPAMPVVKSVSGTAACQGDTVLLSVALQTGATYQWINGAMLIATATTNTLRVTATGNYRASVNRCGMDSMSAPFSVTINQKPVSSYTYTNTGLSYSFINSIASAGPYSFLWNFGDGSPTETTLHANHDFAAAGNYVVSLKVTDNVTGCTDSSYGTVPANPVNIDERAQHMYSIFPNPAVSDIQVRTIADASIALTDLYGKAVSAPVAREGELYRIDVRALPRGVYLLRLVTAKGAAIERVLIR